MFHHTHAYIASKLCKSEDSLLLIGSILPDIAVTKIIKWVGGLHGKRSVNNFSKFISKNPSYDWVLKGVIAHNIVDDFTHKNYQGKIGYAFQNNQELVKLVARHYGLDKKAARGFAHNYIESGVDILLLQDRPIIQNKLKQALSRVNKKKLAELLGSYFHIDQEKFYQSLTQFIILFTKYDFSKVNNWVLFWKDLEILLSLKDIGNQKRKELLNIGIDIVKNTYKEFLNYSTKSPLA